MLGSVHIDKLSKSESHNTIIHLNAHFDTLFIYESSFAENKALRIEFIKILWSVTKKQLDCAISLLTHLQPTVKTTSVRYLSVTTVLLSN